LKILQIFWRKTYILGAKVNLQNRKSEYFGKNCKLTHYFAASGGPVSFWQRQFSGAAGLPRTESLLGLYKSCVLIAARGQGR